MKLQASRSKGREVGDGPTINLYLSQEIKAVKYIQEMFKSVIGK